MTDSETLRKAATLSESDLASINDDNNRQAGGLMQSIASYFTR